jgi:hypothetical protein
MCSFRVGTGASFAFRTRNPATAYPEFEKEQFDGLTQHGYSRSFGADLYVRQAVR